MGSRPLYRWDGDPIEFGEIVVSPGRDGIEILAISARRCFRDGATGRQLSHQWHRGPINFGQMGRTTARQLLAVVAMDSGLVI